MVSVAEIRTISLSSSFWQYDIEVLYSDITVSPHEIFPGGAGTTAAGLRYKLPTFVCPFFGDQHMWGEMVHRAGVGPAPCPICKLTTDVLIEKFRELTSSTIKEAAAVLSVKMDADDGVVNALQHFWSALPRDSMMCSIGLVMGKSLLAKYRIKVGRGDSALMSLLFAELSSIPISAEVASVLVGTSDDFRVDGARTHNLRRSMISRFETFLGDRLRTHPTTTYALRNRGGYDNFFDGYAAVALEFFEHLWRCFYQLFHVPDKFARKHGLVGCIFGMLASPLYFCYAVLKLIVNHIDRLGVTVANGIFGKQWLYFIDRSAVSQVYRDVSTLSETRNHVSARSAQLIREARQITIDARIMFDACKPLFINGCWHYREVQIKDLASRLTNSRGSNLRLSEKEFKTLDKRLNWATTRMDSMSYNRFCLFIGEAVQVRFHSAHARTCLKDSLTEAASCYF
jgi:hypothetical protein